jgi:3D-(3,5/4)-trihydroxycyclohexane-1,2-dione acylhydrolase (decyclizing)
MSRTIKLSLAAALVRFLRAQYIRRDRMDHRLFNGVIGIFGHGNVTGFGQALEEDGGRDFPFYQGKNEQAMVHTAIAYAKTRRRLGTLACTTSVGPGATNLVTGAATATVNRLPVLLLPGDIFAGRAPAPVLQQLEFPGSQDVSVNDCLRPVSKYWDRLNRPEQLLGALPEAVRVLCDPVETGAVTLALPEDVQGEIFPYPVQFFERRVYELDRAPAPRSTLAAALIWIRLSRRPVLIAGGGVHYSEAAEALGKLAAETGLPVGMTQSGMGALLGAHPSALGGIGVTGTSAANAVARDADLVIVVGTRLSDFTTASKTLFQGARVRFIGINVHPMDARKLGALPLVGDARAILEQLRRGLRGWRVPAGHARNIHRLRAQWADRRLKIVAGGPNAPLSQAQVISLLNDECGPDGTVVHAAGGIPGDIHKLWTSNSNLDYHSEYGYSCMGYEIAGALGVKLAAPRRQVFALVGDGSYLMLHSEIVTAIQEHAKITIVLVDNHGFGCISQLQRSRGGNRFGNEFRERKNGRLEGPVVPIDFAKNAESYGALVFRASTARELKSAFLAARAYRGVALIYIQVELRDNMPGFAWWDVPVSGSSLLPAVRSARAKYAREIKQQRFHY